MQNFTPRLIIQLDRFSSYPFHVGEPCNLCELTNNKHRHKIDLFTCNFYIKPTLIGWLLYAKLNDILAANLFPNYFQTSVSCRSISVDLKNGFLYDDVLISYFLIRMLLIVCHLIVWSIFRWYLKENHHSSSVHRFCSL